MKRSSGIIVTGLSASLLSTGALVGSGLLGADDASTTTTATTSTVELASPSAESTASAEPSASTDTSTAAPEATATPEETTDTSTGVSGVYDGEAVTSRYGAFQAEITVEDGVITDIAWLQDGESDHHSQRINDQAIPMLEEAILEAQSVDVGYISGASYTSEAVEDAVYSAMQVAGLA